MNRKFQITVVLFFILSLIIVGCSPPNQSPVTLATLDASPVASATESSTAEPTLNDIISSDNANKLVEISSWGKGSGHYPTYSADGGQLAVSSTSGIYLYNSQTLEETLHLEASHDVFEMAFSPDSKTLSELSGYHFESVVRQWDLTSGSELNSWTIALDYNNGP